MVGSEKQREQVPKIDAELVEERIKGDMKALYPLRTQRGN